MHLDEWILENLDDASVRSKRVDVLTAAAKPIQYSHAEVADDNWKHL